jgi:hypothetical protein
MDNFDGHTTHKHPGNPISVDTEKRDAFLRIREQDAKIKRMSEALNVAIKRLQYCAINPRELHPASNSQYIAASNTLVGLRVDHADALRDAGVGE